MTYDDLNLHEDVRQFVRELDARKKEEPEVKRNVVQVETKTLVGKQAEMYDRSLNRTHVVVNPNSNNTNPNAP